MPAPPINQTISLTGADAVKAQLADLASTGGASLSSLAEKAASGQAGFDSFGGGVNNLAAILSGLSGNIGDVGEKFTGFYDILAAAAPALGSLAGAASLAGLYELASSAAEATHQIESLAAASGSTTEEIQGFQFALASVGVSADTGSSAITKMLAFLGTADDAFRKAADGANVLAEAQTIQAEKADLSAKTAQAAVQSSYNAYSAAADGISKAQVAADRAALSYSALVTQVKASNATGVTAQNNNVRLADSASALKTATDGIAQAQARANAAAVSAGLAQQRAKIADDERTASIDKINSSVEKGISLAQQYAEKWGIAGADVTETTTDGTEAFYKAITGLNGIQNAATRAEVARAIFGRGWKDLIPAINAGGAALKEADDAFQKFGLDLNDSDKDLAGAFNVASREFSSLITAIKNIAGDQLTQLFTPALVALNKWIGENAAGIRQAISDFVNAAKLIEASFGEVLSETVFPAVTAAVTAAAAAFRLLSAAINLLGGNTTAGEVAFFALFLGLAAKLSPIALAISRITGLTSILSAAATELGLSFSAASSLGLAGMLGLGARLGIIGALIAAIIYDINNWDTVWAGNVAAATGFLELMESLWGYIRDTVIQGFLLYVQDFKDAFAAIAAYFQTWVDAFNATVKSIGDFFSNAWQTAISFVEGLWNGLVDWISGAATKIIAAFQPVLTFFQNLWALIQSVTGGSASAGGPGAGSAGGWSGGEVRAAGGGRIIGAGTGTSDSIHALVSNGEFIVNARSAQSVGYGFLHAINEGHANLMKAGGVIRMALGGLVASPQRFAGGGLVAAGAGNPGGYAAVHLHLGGNVFSLMGERGIVQALTGAARKASITATGKAPGWKR